MNKHEQKPKIGLLSLYIELYDKSSPQKRVGIDAFNKTIINELEKRGLEIIASPVCRIKSEFKSAVKAFEKDEVDAIVTLHLAYSPSLESSDILAATKLPIIVLDTTPTYDFSSEQEMEQIFYNHGIHGVQDMCNLLNRNKKSFMIEAGHWEKSDVLDRIAGCARAVKLANNIRNARVGRVGESFKGMGDFAVDIETLRNTIGIETITFDNAEINEYRSEEVQYIKTVDAGEVQREINQDLGMFESEGLDEEVHRQAVISNLITRRWVEKEKLTAFTVNFLNIYRASVISSMPFMEASKAMARGIGYAGEGDILTAALVGALASVYPETSFTEMFCPDWKNNSIFLSHMGEMNINLSAEKPVLKEMNFPYTDAYNPVAAYGRFKEGDVVYVNLAPRADNKYALIVAQGKMLGVNNIDNMKDGIHGWFKPKVTVPDFLEQYSKVGGTHHGAIVYYSSDKVDAGINAGVEGIAGNVNIYKEIIKFGELMGWDVIEI